MMVGKKIALNAKHLLHSLFHVKIWEESDDVYVTGKLKREQDSIFFLGDSQAEFLSRGNQEATCQHLCAHIGPITLMKCGLFGEPESTLGNSITSIIACTEKFGIRNAHVAVSLGTIDVKTFIYLLRTTGTIKSDEDVRNKYRLILNKLAIYFKTIMSENETIKSFGFIEIMPPNNLPFTTPERKVAFSHLRSNFDINPVMGTLADRIKWTAILNEELADVADSSGGYLKFLPIRESIALVSNTNVLDHTLSYDGVHLSNPVVLKDFGCNTSQILNQCQ